jgi:hypothetical protein
VTGGQRDWTRIIGVVSVIVAIVGVIATRPEWFGLASNSVSTQNDARVSCGRNGDILRLCKGPPWSDASGALSITLIGTFWDGAPRAKMLVHERRGGGVIQTYVEHQTILIGNPRESKALVVDRISLRPEFVDINIAALAG